MKYFKRFINILMALTFISLAAIAGRQCTKDFMTYKDEESNVQPKSETVDSLNNISSSSKKSKEDFEKIIQAYIKKTLPKLPHKIDSGTECYKADMKYKEVIYFYRLFKNTKEDFDIGILKKRMQNQINNYYCNAPVLSYFRKENIKMTYHYVDRDYSVLFQVSASLNNCK